MQYVGHGLATCSFGPLARVTRAGVGVGARIASDWSAATVSAQSFGPIFVGKIV